MVEIFDDDYIKDLMNKCLATVSDNYNQEHRHYHNLTHIENMFHEVSNLDFELNQNELIVLCLATIFHDAVYDTQQPDRDNVLQSIKFFETTISDLKIVEQLQEINPQIIPLVRNFIGSTIGHNHNAYSIEIVVEGFN
jgi:predicted metal-dependent HD superfamily phosphohydrolase|nr:hypothetical protein [uncultured Flavobacterium sp.]